MSFWSSMVPRAALALAWGIGGAACGPHVPSLASDHASGPTEPRVASEVAPVDPEEAGSDEAPLRPDWARCRFVDRGAESAKALGEAVYAHVKDADPLAAYGDHIPKACDVFWLLWDRMDSPEAAQLARMRGPDAELGMMMARLTLRPFEASADDDVAGVTHTIEVGACLLPVREDAPCRRIDVVMSAAGTRVMVHGVAIAGRWFIASPPVGIPNLSDLQRELDASLARVRTSLTAGGPAARALVHAQLEDTETVKSALIALEGPGWSAAYADARQRVEALVASLELSAPAKERLRRTLGLVRGPAAADHGGVAERPSAVVEPWSGVPATAISKTDAYDYVIERARLAEAAPSERRLDLHDVRLEMHEIGGKPHGVKLIGVLPGSLARSLGLRSGDILVSVDGTPVDLKNLPRLVTQAFDVAAEMRVAIERREQPKTLTWTFR